MQAHLSFGKVTADALRGVVAATDVKEGDPLALLPNDLIIEMGSQRHSSAVSVQLCTQIVHKKTIPAFDPYHGHRHFGMDLALCPFDFKCGGALLF